MPAGRHGSGKGGAGASTANRGGGAATRGGGAAGGRGRGNVTVEADDAGAQRKQRSRAKSCTEMTTVVDTVPVKAWAVQLSRGASELCRCHYKDQKSGLTCKWGTKKGNLQFVTRGLDNKRNSQVFVFCAQHNDEKSAKFGKPSLECVKGFRSRVDRKTAQPYVDIARIEDVQSLMLCAGVVENAPTGSWEALMAELVKEGWYPILDSEGNMVVDAEGNVLDG